MPANYSSNRDSSSRGGRSRKGGGGRRRSDSSYNSGGGHGSHRGEERVRQHEATRQTVQKKGFFAKILGAINSWGAKKAPAL